MVAVALNVREERSTNIKKKLKPGKCLNDSSIRILTIPGQRQVKTSSYIIISDSLMYQNSEIRLEDLGT